MWSLSVLTVYITNEAVINVLSHVALKLSMTQQTILHMLLQYKLRLLILPLSFHMFFGHCYEA